MEITWAIVSCIIFAVFGYLIGSIPNAVIIGKIHHVDITKIGSGNPGGSNVWREFGWKWGVGCMILDFMKGFIPSLIVLLLTSFIPQFRDGTISQMSFMGYDHLNLYTILTGAMAMIGHAFPIFFHFKGGKNVMVTCGFIGATCPLMMGIAVAMFVTFELISHKISVGSLAAAATVFLYSLVCLIISLAIPSLNENYMIGGWYFTDKIYFLTDWIYGLVLVLEALFVVFRHKSNIKKLAKHEEKNFDPNSHEFDQKSN